MRDGSGRRARQRWGRLRRSLWQPPRPHGEQPRERAVGPLELFYDLAVVVLVAQAAHHLAGHLTWRGLGEFAVVFTLVWIAWTQRQPAPRVAWPRRRPRPQHVPGADLGTRRDGRLHTRGGRRRGERRSPSPPGCCSRCWPCCGCWPPAATGPSTAVEPAVRRWDRGLRRPAGRHRPAAWRRPRASLGPARRCLLGWVRRRDPRRHRRRRPRCSSPTRSPSGSGRSSSSCSARPSPVSSPDWPASRSAC